MSLFVRCSPFIQMYNSVRLNYCGIANALSMIIELTLLMENDMTTDKKSVGRPKGRNPENVKRDLEHTEFQLRKLYAREEELNAELTALEEKIISKSALREELVNCLEENVDNTSAAPYDVKEGEAA